MRHHEIVAQSPNPLGPSEQTVPAAAEGARTVRREGIGSAFVTAGNNPTVRGNELIVMYNVDT